MLDQQFFAVCCCEHAKTVAQGCKLSSWRWAWLAVAVFQQGLLRALHQLKCRFCWASALVADAFVPSSRWTLPTYASLIRAHNNHNHTNHNQQPPQPSTTINNHPSRTNVAEAICGGLRSPSLWNKHTKFILSVQVLVFNTEMAVSLPVSNSMRCVGARLSATSNHLTKGWPLCRSGDGSVAVTPPLLGSVIVTIHLMWNARVRNNHNNPNNHNNRREDGQLRESLSHITLTRQCLAPASIGRARTWVRTPGAYNLRSVLQTPVVGRLVASHGTLCWASLIVCVLRGVVWCGVCFVWCACCLGRLVSVFSAATLFCAR